MVTPTSVPALLEDARRADLAGATARASYLYCRVLAAEEGGSSIARADALRWVGTAALRKGELDEAMSFYEQSLTVARAIGYARGIAHARNCMAVVRHERGEVEAALDLYRQAAAEAAAEKEHRLVGMIENNRAVMMSMQGDWDSALLRYRMSLRAFQEAGDHQATSWTLNNIGTVHRQRRRLREAEEVISLARRMAEQVGDAWTLSTVELNYAELLVDLGQIPRAEALCERNLVLAVEREDLVLQARALRCRSRVLSTRGRWAESSRDLERALGLARACGDVRLESELLVDRGAAEGSQFIPA